MKSQPHHRPKTEVFGDTSKCTECEGPTQISRKGGIAMVMESGANDEAGKPPTMCSKCWRAGL